MTWTDAAEDAISLDDDALIEACLGLDGRKTAANVPTTLPDWPPRAEQSVLVPIEPDIAAWFQARSKTWRRDIARVLRAWVLANKSEVSTPLDSSAALSPADGRTNPNGPCVSQDAAPSPDNPDQPAPDQL